MQFGFFYKKNKQYNIGQWNIYQDNKIPILCLDSLLDV